MRRIIKNHTPTITPSTKTSRLARTAQGFDLVGLFPVEEIEPVSRHRLAPKVSMPSCLAIDRLAQVEALDNPVRRERKDLLHAP